jgi:hypothetical protein
MYMFSKLKIFQTSDLLMLVLKEKLEIRDRWATFVNGDRQVSTWNQEKEREEEALSDMNSDRRPTANRLLTTVQCLRAVSLRMAHICLRS